MSQANSDERVEEIARLVSRIKNKHRQAKKFHQDVMTAFPSCQPTEHSARIR